MIQQNESTRCDVRKRSDRADVCSAARPLLGEDDFLITCQLCSNTEHSERPCTYKWNIRTRPRDALVARLANEEAFLSVLQFDRPPAEIWKNDLFARAALMFVQSVSHVQLNYFRITQKEKQDHFLLTLCSSCLCVSVNFYQLFFI